MCSPGGARYAPVRIVTPPASLESPSPPGAATTAREGGVLTQRDRNITLVQVPAGTLPPFVICWQPELRFFYKGRNRFQPPLWPISYASRSLIATFASRDRSAATIVSRSRHESLTIGWICGAVWPVHGISLISKMTGCRSLVIPTAHEGAGTMQQRWRGHGRGCGAKMGS